MSDQASGTAQTAWTNARALMSHMADGTTPAAGGTIEQVTTLLREAVVGGVAAASGDLGRHLVRTADGNAEVLREALSHLAAAAKKNGGDDTLSYARAVHLLPAELTSTHYVAAASRLNELLRTAPSVEAMVFTAYMLANGHGYAVNPGRARAMIQAAADAGSADALFELYVYDATGFNGSIDLETATSHLHQAAKLGSPRAMANLAGAYATGQGMARDDSKALTWYLRAAEAGSVRAAATLAQMYGTGQGVERNDAKSERYAERAHELALRPLEV